MGSQQGQEGQARPSPCPGHTGTPWSLVPRSDGASAGVAAYQGCFSPSRAHPRARPPPGPGRARPACPQEGRGRRAACQPGQAPPSRPARTESKGGGRKGTLERGAQDGAALASPQWETSGPLQPEWAAQKSRLPLSQQGTGKNCPSERTGHSCRPGTPREDRTEPRATTRAAAGGRRQLGTPALGQVGL